MPVTIQADRHDSDSSNQCPYDYMETFIDYDSNEGSVLFCPSPGTGDVCYESDTMTPEQWSQIVELDKEMMEVFSDYISRAAQILEGNKNNLAA